MCHFVLTAETHNFPTAISPFEGAATGIGGRIRDVMATGRGATPICSSAGYCVGELFSDDTNYPNNMAKPTQILIEASNGASDYGNKFGEPIILGFSRSFKLENYNERIEWIKPIMFTAGLGMIHEKDLYKKLGIAVKKWYPLGSLRWSNFLHHIKNAKNYFIIVVMINVVLGLV